MRTESSRPMGDRPQRAAGGKFGAKPKSRGDRGDRPGGSSTGGRFFRKKTCRLCSETANPLDYKDKDRLSRYLTEKGKIIPRRTTGNCARCQRVLVKSIKRARHSAILAFEIAS
jgi:small subunit ribosomal protein S18